MRQNARSKESKLPGAEPGIVADGDAFSAVFPKRIRKPLRGAANGIFVHSIGADAQNAPKTARPEGQFRSEGREQLLFAAHKRFGRFLSFFIKMRIRCPELCPFHCQHGNSSSTFYCIQTKGSS